MIWVTLDVEEVMDMNFSVKWKSEPKIDYEKYIDYFIQLSRGCKTTAFVLGDFAKKYPQIVKKISNSGIEIACHGLKHNFVYKEGFEDWSRRLKESKELLEELIDREVLGYRSPSWSMPFEKRYYKELARLGFKYSSSYFPMKNYMYGNSIDKKEPFFIATEFGKIEERPIPKYIIPFSGGFYLRVLPLWILNILFKKAENSVLYIHPYELMDKNLLRFFKKYADKNLDYFLAFYSTGYGVNKLKSILR